MCFRLVSFSTIVAFSPVAMQKTLLHPASNNICSKQNCWCGSLSYTVCCCSQVSVPSSMLLHNLGNWGPSFRASALLMLFSVFGWLILLPEYIFLVVLGTVWWLLFWLLVFKSQGHFRISYHWVVSHSVFLNTYTVALLLRNLCATENAVNIILHC